MESDADTVVRLCGTLAVEIDGARIEGKIPVGQATQVFGYLVLNRTRTVRRDELIEALWPRDQPRDPQAVLSTLLSRLRAGLKPIEISGKSELRIVLPEPAWVDVEAARVAVDDGLRAQDADEWSTAQACARRALDLTDDDLLPGHDGTWVSEVRADIEEIQALALETIARSAVAGGGTNLAEGRRAAQTLVARAPFRETGYRLLMEVLETGGDVAEALRVYDDLRRMLRDELGAGPAANVQALHKRLLDGGRPREDRGATGPGSGLPMQRTSFVGRRDELRDLEHLMRDGRAMTIVASGGMGKTRLALRAAELLDTQLDEGAWLIELAALGDSELVPRAVAAALAVREEPGRSIEESIAKQLDGRELCVVLDNCEHVLGAAAQLAHALLATAPRLRLIATSREPLGYSGERVFPLGPMPTDSDAAELFRQRAVSATADFAVTPANAGAVARICSRLDGMPLALELAAALVAVMGVEDIDERLDEQLRLRMTGAVTAPERHRTLAALVRWSYGLLAPDEQMLFRRLAVFHGGFTLDGAERVCGGERRLDVMPALTALVRKSLVVKDEREGRARYSMLETIRQFALVELDASGEGQRIRGAHLAFYRDLAEEHEPLLADGRRQVAALDRLELELDNFRSAIATGLEPGGDETAAAEAAGALFALWYLRGYMSEGGRWLEATATAAMDSAPQAAAKALAGAGELAREQGDYALARERLRASLELARRDGITSGYGGVPFSLFNLGCTAWEEGEYGEARDLLEESLALCPHESEDAQFHVGWPLLKLGQVALDEGQPEAAMGLFERSLVRHRSRGDREGLARTLEQLGRAALARGDLRGARLLSERSIEAANELGYVEGLHGPLLNLARVDLHEGDTDGALERSREALTIVAQLGSRRGLAAALEATACVECARGGHERAATLFGAAAALREEIGSPVPGHLRDELDGAIAVARARCDTPSAAWAAGFSMSSDDARAFAVATS